MYETKLPLFGEKSISVGSNTLTKHVNKKDVSQDYYEGKMERVIQS